VKGSAECVADGLEDVPAMLVDATPYEGVMPGECCAHGFRPGFPQSRAALDIREQQCDGASGKIGHRAVPRGARLAS